MTALAFASLSCGKSDDEGGGGSGKQANVRIEISDKANYNGKWEQSNTIAADILAGGSTVGSSKSVSFTNVAQGKMLLALQNLNKIQHNIFIYSPSNKTIPANQNSKTAEFRLGSSSFTPKSDVSLEMDIQAVTCTYTILVSNENADYSGWNLETVILRANSAIAGTLDLSQTAPSISGNGEKTVIYEIENPSALRTKAQKVVFRIFPIKVGEKATLCYNLEKNGKRVAISHEFAFPESGAGTTVNINETIPSTLEGAWSAEGSGIVYTNVFPGKTWETTSPESRGYSSEKFEAFRKSLANVTTTSMMVAVGGKVIFSFGDIKENVKIASCRKSLLSTLYGKYVESGTIDLNKTLKELGIDEDENSWGGSVNWDGGKLLESEKEATIKDLLTARSGIFHKPANSGDDHDYMKASDRGKYPHGTYYLYNNWDFNCAGAVFEQLTGKDIYAAFKTDIADPCGWEDYDLSIQKKTEEFKGASKFLAYHFHISTRDMLRMALLMLNKGNWDGKQVVSQKWAEQITSVYTKRSDMHPSYRLTREFEYGWLWWTFCPQFTGYDASIFAGGFTATGSGGQYITVLPALNMVIAHKDKTQKMEKSTYYNIIKQVAACKE